MPNARRALATALAALAVGTCALVALIGGGAPHAASVVHPHGHASAAAHRHLPAPVRSSGVPAFGGAGGAAAAGSAAAGAAAGALAVHACTSNSPTSCAHAQTAAAFVHAAHAAHASAGALPQAQLPQLGLNSLGAPYPPLPLNRYHFPCTQDGANPLQGGAYLPCCPGSSAKPVPDGAGAADGDDQPRVCSPDPSEGSKLVECVSTDAVPIPFRCDLTSTDGATSCPFARMYDRTRYLVYPGGSTACLYPPTLTGRQPCEPSSPIQQMRESNRFSFDVRKGDPSRLLLFFQGGGACWASDAAFCTTVSRPNSGGLLDDALPDKNRYANWTVVQVHYCSGDSFVADVTQPWVSPEWPRLPVRQAGAANTRAVLAWIVAQPEFRQLDEFVFAGASAGSLGAQVWARPLLDQLGARSRATAAIFDSYAGVSPIGHVKGGGGELINVGGRLLRDTWRVCGSDLVPASARDACASGQLGVSMLLGPALTAYGTAGGGGGKTTFTQIQSKQDLVQRAFYDLMGDYYHLDFPSAIFTLEGNEHIYTAASALFKGYKQLAPRGYFATLVDGNCHTFVGLPDWFEATSAGPGAGRSAASPTSGGAGADASGDALLLAAAAVQFAQLQASASEMRCSAHPFRRDVVAGSQLLAYLKLADWASLPLVPTAQADPRARPPLWAAIKDNCYGPIVGDALASQHPLYACPPLDYVQYGLRADSAAMRDSDPDGHPDRAAPHAHAGAPVGDIAPAPAPAHEASRRAHHAHEPRPAHEPRDSHSEGRHGHGGREHGDDDGLKNGAQPELPEQPEQPEQLDQPAHVRPAHAHAHEPREGGERHAHNHAPAEGVDTAGLLKATSVAAEAAKLAMAASEPSAAGRRERAERHK